MGRTRHPDNMGCGVVLRGTSMCNIHHMDWERSWQGGNSSMLTVGITVIESLGLEKTLGITTYNHQPDVLLSPPHCKLSPCSFHIQLSMSEASAGTISE